MSQLVCPTYIILHTFNFFTWIPKIEFISLFHKLASFFVFYSFFFVNPEEHLLSRLESGCRGSVNIHYKHISPTYSISLYCRGRRAQYATVCFYKVTEVVEPVRFWPAPAPGIFFTGSGSSSSSYKTILNFFYNIPCSLQEIIHFLLSISFLISI